ncbi:damage-inducible protein CinA [Mucilaginibacter hurinus]|uniref:Damage-inducible protein CinA n=1 Tax=Mucilaginibacter hurinus TaxID=2201324 RepID=A0A367GNJ4_9SPHI|nr:CinA family protein [Mucilaginibacter hurinus]RCH55047.1 damage-inducible protein CinA [Mucilaginibacter hurinus]
MAEQRILECSKLMAEKNLTIAFAESATAGWLCSEFALAPESGRILKGGIVCYDATLKEDILKVPHVLIEKYTPESEEVTAEMARRLGGLIPSDIQIGVTGLTTPGGSENYDKPVGTMFVYAFIHGKPVSLCQVYTGSQEDIIHQTIDAVAQMLINEIGKMP